MAGSLGEFDCAELTKMIRAALEDERKAQFEYTDMARRAGAILSEGLEKEDLKRGALVSAVIKTIVADEAKHEDFLRELLKAVRQQCPEPGGPVIMAR